MNDKEYIEIAELYQVEKVARTACSEEARIYFLRDEYWETTHSSVVETKSARMGVKMKEMNKVW